IPGLKEHAFTLKSLNQARLLRTHLKSCFARYPLERRPELLRFVVGGAGFSGIELVGEFADALPELASEAGVSLEKVEIYNVEAAPGILPGFDADLVASAERSLKQRGVRFLTGVPIVRVEPGVVHLKTGDAIAAETIVWTGGVRGNQLVVDAGFETDPRGRAKVDAYLQSTNYADVYLLGDCALILNEEGRPFPPTAQLAWQTGSACGRYLYHDIHGGQKEEFHPDILGSIASLGRKDAVGKVGHSYKTRGRVAYMLKDASQYRYLVKIGAVFGNK
ncbi:MAG: NAD(P)/FAD-dependent oxidoreductase, partial [Bacilli bacterium]